MSTPFRRNIMTSYFKFCPILSTAALLEQRAQLLQHDSRSSCAAARTAARRRCGRPGCSMPCRARCEADADQFGPHVLAMSVSVSTATMPSARLGDPAIERRLVDDRLVILVDEGRLFLGRRRQRRRRGGRGDAELGQQRAEALIFEKGAHRLGRQALEREVLERLGQGSRRPARPARATARASSASSISDCFSLGFRSYRSPRALPRGAMLADQLGRGLRADAGHAGDIVDAIAHQRQHVAELARA